MKTRSKSSFRALGLSAVVALAAAGFGGAVMQGCGSSNSASDYRALCEKNCAKVDMCIAPGAIANCKALCSQQGDGGTSQRCRNESAIVSKLNECVDKPCADYLSCVQTVPACDGTSGSGGATGSGGSGFGGSGSGGSGTGGSGTGGSGTGGNQDAGIQLPDGFSVDLSGFDLGIAMCPAGTASGGACTQGSSCQSRDGFCACGQNTWVCF